MHKKTDSSSECVRVIQNERIAEGVYLLSLASKPSFSPGQIVALTPDPAIEPRLYSIASGLHDPYLQILFDVKPGGKLSPLLAGLGPGDPIYVTEPGGSFLCDEQPAVWIAAGTGIAPFLSMFRSGEYHEKILIHGARTIQGFYFQEQFLHGMKEKYIRCCSGEKGEGFYPGRVSSYLENNYVPDPAILHYICGSAEFIVDIRDVLISRGIPFENIMAEIYF